MPARRLKAVTAVTGQVPVGCMGRLNLRAMPRYGAEATVVRKHVGA
jgi:hypothetical protein